MLSIELLHKMFKFIKIFVITIFTYKTTKKIMNNNMKENIIINTALNILAAIIYYIFKIEVGWLFSIIILITFMTVIIAKRMNKSIGYTIICTVISLTINNIIFCIASAIIFIPCKILNFQNQFLIITIINLLYIIGANLFLRIRKLKNGLSFLATNINNEYFDILFLNISAIILFSLVLISDYNIMSADRVGVSLIFFAIIMFITIQKSLQLYYKQKLLIKELNETKEELAKKTKEVEDLETENLSISKKAHTLDHKQKSLAKKIDEMMMNTEISKDEVAEVKERLNKIGKDLYKEKTTVELSKTGITQIDDMLSYMQSECAKNKIDFELQLKGNIYYMTNNLISIEDLETLLADHIKNAIIAINHTDNINRSILVRLGEIDGIYSLYIYDSGVEFSKETLENLGKKPSTTHADEGGTGMGFMNTFDTLRKCKASLIIEEIGEPTKDDYTKAIIIKFNSKNEFKIISYRQ